MYAFSFSVSVFKCLDKLIPVLHISLVYVDRQKALKALNERLKKLEQPITWPTLEDASPTKPQKPAEIPDGEVPEVVVQKNTVEEGDPS